MSGRKFKLLRREAKKQNVPYKVAKKFYKSLNRRKQITLLTSTS
jgi:hypothetical protein